MSEIPVLFACLSSCLGRTTFRQLLVIVPAVFSMSGRVTMLNISRWTDKGGSYRTIQRFFNTIINWSLVHGVLFWTHLFQPDDLFIMAGDEVVITKSGQETYGLNKFFSSIYGKVVPGLSFFGFSLINVTSKKSTLLRIEQILRLPSVPEASPPPEAPSRKRGRPKGSRNKNRTDVVLSEYHQWLQTHLKALLDYIRHRMTISILVLDGAFGTNSVAQMVLQCDMHLISKLKHNSALYLPYDGTYSGKGRRKIYGIKLDYQKLPRQFLKHQITENHIRTEMYQMEVLHKSFAQRLNVVILIKAHLKTQRQAHVVLFSTDLSLTAAQIVEYYGLRFQIEFNFRDAKQYFGLEDFMNIKQIPVTNVVNFAFLMVNLSQIMIKELRTSLPDAYILDIKAHYRGLKFFRETLKFVQGFADPILIQQTKNHLARIGAIHYT